MKLKIRKTVPEFYEASWKCTNSIPNVFSGFASISFLKKKQK